MLHEGESAIEPVCERVSRTAIVSVVPRTYNLPRRAVLVGLSISDLLEVLCPAPQEEYQRERAEYAMYQQRQMQFQQPEQYAVPPAQMQDPVALVWRSFGDNRVGCGTSRGLLCSNGAREAAACKTGVCSVQLLLQVDRGPAQSPEGVSLASAPSRRSDLGFRGAPSCVQI